MFKINLTKFKEWIYILSLHIRNILTPSDVILKKEDISKKDKKE